MYTYAIKEKLSRKNFFRLTFVCWRRVAWSVFFNGVTYMLAPYYRFTSNVLTKGVPSKTFLLLWTLIILLTENGRLEEHRRMWCRILSSVIVGSNKLDLSLSLTFLVDCLHAERFKRKLDNAISKKNRDADKMLIVKDISEQSNVISKECH